jgi:hypothetical protein
MSELMQLLTGMSMRRYFAGQGHSGFGAALGQGIKSGATPTSQDDRQYIAHGCPPPGYTQ